MWKLLLSLVTVTLIAGAALIVSIRDPLGGRSDGSGAVAGAQTVTDVATALRRRREAAQVASGIITAHTLGASHGPAYYLYVPRSEPSPQTMLVTVHGISRNAREHIEAFQSKADEYGVILVAPVFDEEAFQGYQRLLFPKPDTGRERADTRLQSILADASRLTGVSSERFYLFGHSGGAQFAHRYVMAYPRQVKRYAISAAGWYTPPDLATTYPYGMKPRRKRDMPELDIDAFLHIPACVLVGAGDIERDETLNQAERLDATQGRTRVERAEYWVGAMTAAARWRELETEITLQILPNAGHDFTEMAEHGRMAETVFACLFGQSMETAGSG